MVQHIRIVDGREEKTSFIIVDAQSVKNTDTAENKGYDAGKKVSGIKRHIAVDTQGLPHAIHVTTANITDREGAVEMINDAKENLKDVKNVLVDGGYSGEKFSSEVNEMIDATVEVAKRSELHKFVVIPKRWVVERSFLGLKNVEGCGKTAREKSIQVYKWLSLLLLGYFSKDYEFFAFTENQINYVKPF